jgi:hypothetical protein
MRKAFGSAQGGADHGSTRMSILRSTSRGRSGATVLMGGILSSSPRTRLPDDPPPRRSIHRLLDHACDSAQRVRRSSGCSGCSGSLPPWRLRRGRELLSGGFASGKRDPAATMLIEHAEAMKRPLRRHPRATPRPARLLPIPPVARHLAARPFFARPMRGLGLPIRRPCPLNGDRRGSVHHLPRHEPAAHPIRLRVPRRQRAGGGWRRRGGRGSPVRRRRATNGLKRSILWRVPSCSKGRTWRWSRCCESCMR